MEHNSDGMVRCRATLPDGRHCGAALWRVCADGQLEVSHSLRSGRRLTIALPLSAARQTRISCVRCGTKWWPAERRHPRLVPVEHAALAIVAERPATELASVLGHSAVAHPSEVV